MIRDDNFLKLKEALCKATIAFEKNKDGYKIYFNNYSDYNEFECQLTSLHYNFINEVRNNIIKLNIDKESGIYLDMLLHIFEIFDEQIQTCSDFVSPHNNVKIVSKNNSKLSCIPCSFNDFSEMMAYFQYQKKIIHKSIKFILTSRDKCKKSFIKKEDIQSWETELLLFYPEMLRLKDAMNRIPKIRDKILYLQEERTHLCKEYQKKGKDIYSSPINLFFESRIESMKDLLLCIDLRNERGDLRNESFANKDIAFEPEAVGISKLKWTESKTALVELIYSLHSSNSINEGRVEIKRMTQMFEFVFDIDLGDVYHTFTEIRNRKIEQTKFIDLLKDSLLNRMKEANEKIID